MIIKELKSAVMAKEIYDGTVLHSSYFNGPKIIQVCFNLCSDCLLFSLGQFLFFNVFVFVYLIVLSEQDRAGS